VRRIWVLMAAHSIVVIVVSSILYLAGFTARHQDPYLRLALAEVVDVGISEHTEKVCNA
jgi:hypothetical protein